MEHRLTNALQPKLETPHADNPHELLDAKKAAKHIDFTVGTMAVWRCTRRYIIPHLKFKNRIKYRVSDLDAFLASYYKPD